MPRQKRGIFGRGAWEALLPHERETYEHKLELVRLLREKIPPRKAEKLAHSKIANSQKYLGSTIRRNRRGKIIVTPADRLYRRMTVISPDGTVTVEVRGSRAASLIGRHHNAVQDFIATRDPAVLRDFRGKSVGGHELATDPTLLRRLGREGELDFPDVYELTA